MRNDRKVPARITDYLSLGGLWNPELANHEAVRDLLIDARDVIEIDTREMERLRTAHESQAEYAIKLQRLIEAHAHGRPLPYPELHHSKMLAAMPAKLP
jgi:hypothetical protein